MNLSSDFFIIIQIKNKFRSLIEWKNKFIYYFKVPIKIDIHATDHCNLNCLGCTHFSPLANSEFCDLETLEKSLKKLSLFKKDIGTIQILGGEPLLNKDLSKMINLIRYYFEDVTLNLITNGILLFKENDLPFNFWSSCKKNKVNLKVTKYPLSIDYNVIKNLCTKNNVNFEIFADRSEGERGWHRFLLKETGSDVWVFKSKLFKLLSCRSKNCFQLVGNRIFPCSHVAYVHHLNKFFKSNFKQRKNDYIEVDKLKSSLQLRKLMLFSIPFCNYCGAGYPETKWNKSKFQPDEWYIK